MQGISACLRPSGARSRGSRGIGSEGVQVGDNVQNLLVREVHVRHGRMWLDQHVLDVLSGLPQFICYASKRRRTDLCSVTVPVIDQVTALTEFSESWWPSVAEGGFACSSPKAVGNAA